jgi:hypothetical protein
MNEAYNDPMFDASDMMEPPRRTLYEIVQSLPCRVNGDSVDLTQNGIPVLSINRRGTIHVYGKTAASDEQVLNAFRTWAKAILCTG